MAFSMIHPREVERILRDNRGILIDVREPEEYQVDHIFRARNFPYDKIDIWKNYFPKNRALVMYCDYGSTSLLAARKLGKEGYEVYTVIGGIEAMKNYREAHRW